MISPYVWSLAVTVAIALGLGVLTWRNRSEPGAVALGVLLACVVAWSGGYAVSLLVYDPAMRVAMEKLTWMSAAFTPLAWLVFALRYTGVDRLSRPLVALLSVPPVAAIGLVWTNASHHLIWTDVHVRVASGVALLIREFGPAYWLFLLYAGILVLAGVLLMLRLVFTAEHLFVDQALALAVGALVPLLAHLLSILGLSPLPGLELTPHAFAASGLAVGYALHRSDLLRQIPATRRIGRQAVVRNMPDGVLVLDDEDTVVDANAVAERQFGADRSALFGDPVSAVFDDPDFELPEREGAVVWSGAGPLEFEIQVSELTDQHERRVGRILVVRDVTDRTNRRQQLQVLNRVLRHNFRNDMNVIDAYATRLAERLDGEEADLAASIQRVARELAETSTKARDIEHIMSRWHGEPQPVDLPALITRLVEDLREDHPEATVETDLPDSLEIRSTGILESVLGNVLENAVEHNDGEDPRVWVRARAVESGDTVEISVADDGPGIPQQERDVLLEGTETPLEHGSGLGLWLIHWGVTMLDGDLEFSDRATADGSASVPPTAKPASADGGCAGDGSVVTIRVPREQQTHVMVGAADDGAGRDRPESR
ncbi:MAG: histidine kinase N-terminal 7TM domain-containing protein [Halorientalis sp.]